MSLPVTPALDVVRHREPLIFLAAARPAYAGDDATESLFASWAHALVRNPLPRGERLYLASCAEGGALQRGTGPVMIGHSSARAARALAADLATDWPQLLGVVGERRACLAFARGWRERTGRSSVLRLHLRQHRLTVVSPVPPPPGHPRLADESDTAWLINAQLEFLVEARITSHSPADVAAAVPMRIACGEFWIWDNGGPVAYAGYSDAAPEVARIAPVYTLPECRRRGYATALVAALSTDLLARDKRALFLSTDVANSASNAVYARVGYRPLSDQYHFDFVGEAGDA